MKYGKQFIFGGIVFFFLPIAMYIKYIVHYIRQKPSGKKLVFWFFGYYVLFLPIWYIIEEKVNYNKYIIYQSKRGNWIDLNGIEYIFYGFSVLVAFTALCLIFHFIYFIVKKLKNKKP